MVLVLYMPLNPTACCFSITDGYWIYWFDREYVYPGLSVMFEIQKCLDVSFRWAESLNYWVIIHWLRMGSCISSSAQLILMHDSHVSESTSLNLIMLLLSTTHVFVTMALMGYLLGSMLTSRTLLFLFLFIVCGLYLTAQVKHLLASIMFFSWVCLRNLALRWVTELCILAWWY